VVGKVDVLIESTHEFENDLSKLPEREKELIIQRINNCTDLYLTQPDSVYSQMHCVPLSSELGEYDSSLYTLQVSEPSSVILTVDEDPIFEQVIFTLFRVVDHSDLDRAYKDVANFLYQDLLPQNREIAKAS
jgi:hypothetical protein